MKILCLIPARSGSKGIPHKNIRSFKNKPLIVWSIQQALSSKYKEDMKIVVTTDSEEYRKIAIECGAEAPFLRPPEISKDESIDSEFIVHAVDFLEKENYKPDIILQLRPTQPCRKVEDIDKCIDLFIENRDNYDSLRTVVPFLKCPQKMYIIKDNQLIPYFKKYENIDEPYNQCRQLLPNNYLHNGYIDILNTSIIKNGTISGEKILPYIMNDSDTIDIDNEDDWIKAEIIATYL